MTDPFRIDGARPVDARRGWDPGPSRLRRALGAFGSEGPAVPSELDHTLRAAVRAHAARCEGPRVQPWRRAAAAALLLAASILAIQLVSSPAATSARDEPVVRSLARAIEHRRDAGLASPALSAILATLVAMPADVRATLDHTDALRFARYAVVLEGDASRLGAWYIDIAGDGAIVGIEGGDPPGSSPATYDPAALVGGRIRLARLVEPASLGADPRVATVVMHEPTGARDPRVLRLSTVDEIGRPLALSARLLPLPDPHDPSSSTP